MEEKPNPYLNTVLNNDDIQIPTENDMQKLFTPQHIEIVSEYTETVEKPSLPEYLKKFQNTQNKKIIPGTGKADFTIPNKTGSNEEKKNIPFTLPINSYLNHFKLRKNNTVDPKKVNKLNAELNKFAFNFNPNPDSEKTTTNKRHQPENGNPTNTNKKPRK